jgi:ribosome maturation factor RimP
MNWWAWNTRAAAGAAACCGSTLTRFAGQLVKLRTAYPVEGQRRFKGRLQGLQDRNVVIVQDDQEISLPYDQIEQARLVPEY